MKKLLYLLILALPLVVMNSCDDDDDVPNVSLSATIDGATRVDNTLYVVSGETLDIESINIIDNTKKGAVIGSASYFWDYYRLGGTIVAPYGMEIDTDDIPLGNHLLQIKVSIYAVDYSPCIGYMEYPVKIVASEDDIPTDGEIEPSPTLNLVVTTDDDAD
ncbi:hypothetical protein ED352_03010 [Muribaculaceae bacterium Isolate-002 (NCI)]|nr:hypothetical protein ED352_03010 [Muribaculaceae bacterium Isolate-002 (NCI)]